MLVRFKKQTYFSQKMLISQSPTQGYIFRSDFEYICAAVESNWLRWPIHQIQIRKIKRKVPKFIIKEHSPWSSQTATWILEK